MQKNKKGIFIIIGLTLIIIGFIIAIVLNNKKEYIINSTFEEIKEKMENEETFILYIGKENCSACQAFNPKIENIAKKYKLEIYYIDLATFTTEQTEYITKAISFTGTPTVVFIEKGKDSLNNDTKIIGNISEDKITTKLKNRGYIKK